MVPSKVIHGSKPILSVKSLPDPWFFCVEYQFFCIFKIYIDVLTSGHV